MSETEISVYTEDSAKVGTYSDFFFTVYLIDYPTVVSTPPKNANQEFEIKDGCSVENGLAFTTSTYLS